MFRKYLILILISASVFAQGGFDYYNRTSFAGFAGSSFKYGFYGYDNPALLSTFDAPELYFSLGSYNAKFSGIDKWGVISSFPGFAFGTMHEKYLGKSVSDYYAAFGAGSQAFSVGAGYAWSYGDKTAFGHTDIFSFGMLNRPNKYVSAGITAFLKSGADDEYVFDAAVRPLGNEILSVFYDYQYKKNYTVADNKWSAGATVEFAPGVRITGRYFENKSAMFGVNLSLGNLGINSSKQFDDNGRGVFTNIGLRAGGYDRTLLEDIFPSKKYFTMALNGNVKYRRFRFFDNSITLKDILTDIEAAIDDNSVKGIALNLSGFNANREMLWEIRNKLLEFKQSGKKIFIYVDNADIDMYYLASAADKLVIDPQGNLLITGYVLGKTYFKGLLDKLDIGFDEWRYYKYKSAMETFSRKSMSEGEKEQLQRLADEYYEITRDGVCEEREITQEEFDRIVNEEGIITAGSAVEFKLADALGRWEKVEELIAEAEGEQLPFTGSYGLKSNKMPTDNYWGEKPALALIYALGTVAMDEGIKARELKEYIAMAQNNPNIKAVVLRVDSPGGDPLAADIVAEAVKKCRKVKPVIVSMGYVAASGGYWISSDADAIVASPNTITASIGVIGGWFYNNGLKDSLGLSTDYVKRGKMADFSFGMRLPLINMSLPDRNLTDYEVSKMKTVFDKIYSDFISKTAAGRNLKKEEVEALAQGRVWSGRDALKQKLVDHLGGLDKALSIAKEKGGITDNNYRIIELPAPGFIDFSSFMPKFSPISVDSKSIDELKIRMQFNGMPLLMTPSEVYNPDEIAD